MISHCKHCKHESRDTTPNYCPKCKAFKPWIEGRAPNQGSVLTLSDVRESEVIKHTISNEIDEAFDGGMVQGGVYVLSGDPGIGKSTLALQMLGRLAEQKVLYVSSEEAGEHIKARGQRINVQNTRIRILETSSAVRIEKALDEERPDWIVQDSISAVQVEDLARGSIQGQKEYIARLYQRAHKYAMGAIVIAHVTKDGDMAGPKALEHEVDVFSMFEGERKDSLRVLRTLKNRFGQTPRMGLFEMAADGLRDVENAGNALFRGRATGPGSVLGAAWIDGRCLLVEIQVLLGPVPERFEDRQSKPVRPVIRGLDPGRVSLVQAILSRFGAGIEVGREMYVNVVGGLKIDDPCLDLPLALAMISAQRDITVDKSTVYAGEMGLLGEILEGPKWQERKRMVQRADFQLKTWETIKDALANFT